MGTERNLRKRSKAIGKLASLLPSPLLTSDAIEFMIAPAVADMRRLKEFFDPELTPLREGLETYLMRRPSP